MEFSTFPYWFFFGFKSKFVMLWFTLQHQIANHGPNHEFTFDVNSNIGFLIKQKGYIQSQKHILIESVITEMCVIEAFCDV